MRTRTPYIHLFLLILLLLSCCNKWQNKDPYPEIELPIYQGASEVSINYDNKIYGKSLRYFLNEKFPAPDVIKFYELYLSRKGFKKFANYPYTDSGWVKFNNNTLNWDISANSPPARYFTAWIDKDYHLIFKLTFMFENSEKLSVTCFIHPYVSHNSFIAFDNKVKKIGREKEFAEFLSKYTKTDHTIDIERALKENPDNEIIKEFAHIAEQNKIDIEKAYKAYKQSLKEK